jgi:hypothetical protein
MATGRTTSRWTRVYADGYDLSGVARDIGPLDSAFDEHDVTAMGDSVKTYLPGHPYINAGTLNAIFDNTATTGIHNTMRTTGKRVVTVAKGIRAIPAAGDPVFCGEFLQSAYNVAGEGGVVVNMPFAGWAADATHRAYPVAWGQLIHASALRDAVNAADAGVESPTGAATNFGGFMVYHVTATTGAAGTTATIKIQHSADEVDANYADLAGCTTGVIDVGTAPVGGVLATTTNVTEVLRYLRWQVVIGTVTNLTFTLSFVRGIA